MILVTGGTGLLGSHLLFELTQSGKKVRATKRPGSAIENVYKTFRFYVKDPEPLLNQIEWIDADLNDLDALYNALSGIEYVHHCAGKISFSESDKQELHQVNIEGTANLINACLAMKPKKFIHVSSIAALGDPADEMETINERTPWNHNIKHSSYSFSKFKGEMEVWRGIAEGLNAVIINPSVILGPGNWEKGSAGFFTMVWNGLNYYTEGITGFVDVRDVCEIMIHLMNHDITNEKYVVSSENLSYLDFFTMIAESLGKKPPQTKTSKFLLDVGWRTDYLVSNILFRDRKLTRNTAQSAMKKQFFSSRKIIDELNTDFIPVKESINHVASKFLKDYLK